jgi:hypothetical protein
MDYLTVCLQTDEATVIAILKGVPFNHTYVQTFGAFTNGDLIFQTYQGGAPGAVGGSTDNGNKVVIHTRRP